MKKIIRLNESDLTRIVKRVINEGVEVSMPLKDNVNNLVKTAGAIVPAGQTNPTKFLNGQIYYSTDEKEYLIKIGNDTYSLF